MPTENQIKAAATVLINNGCDKAHAAELARHVLRAAETAGPIVPAKVADLFCDWPADYHEQFWKMYPHKRTRAAAMKALDKIHHKGDVPWETLIGGLHRYIHFVNGQDNLNWMHPATWLNGESWLDEFAPSKDNGSRNGFAAIARI